MLNVIIINDFADVTGGATKVAIENALGLTYEGVNVYYFCSVGKVDSKLSSGYLKEIIHLNQEEILYSRSKINALLRGLWNKRAEKKMAKLLKRFDNTNTIVHVHGWTKALSVSPIAVALKNNFRTVITLHDFFIYCPNGAFYNYQQASICHKTPLSLSCILSNCDSRNYVLKLYRVLRSSLQKAMFNYYKSKISLIGLSKLSYDVLAPYLKDFKSTYFVENSIDTSHFPRVKAEQNINAVFVGRLSPEKGISYFCEALKLLNTNNAIIVGEGPIKIDLEKRYSTLTFKGWQNKEQIKDIFKTARFLVLPSVWYETYGLVVREAASYGIPCVVSDCCAAAEFIDHDINGLIFKSKDVQNLAQNMDKLFQDNFQTKILSENIYNKFWAEDHSRKSSAKKLKDIYYKILQDHANVKL